MIAQAYLSDRCVRIFAGETVAKAGEAIADLPLLHARPSSATEALGKVRMRKQSRWVRTEWGWQARVDFANSQCAAK